MSFLWNLPLFQDCHILLLLEGVCVMLFLSPKYNTEETGVLEVQTIMSLGLDVFDNELFLARSLLFNTMEK